MLFFNGSLYVCGSRTVVDSLSQRYWIRHWASYIVSGLRLSELRIIFIFVVPLRIRSRDAAPCSPGSSISTLHYWIEAKKIGFIRLRMRGHHILHY